MRAQKVLARDFQFYFPDLDNIILVQSHEDESVTIRASKDNCSEDRKIFFIRKLAAEGFIPDQYQWFTGSTDASNGVLWIKDFSWLRRRPVVDRQTNRFMVRLLVAGSILLAAMLRVLLVSHPPAVAQNPTALEASATFDLSDIHGRRVNRPLLVP